MAPAPLSQPSFSPRRKWVIGLNVTILSLLVLAVVVMVNYLSRDYFGRFHWSTRSKIELSPLTLKFLSSLTNRVKVTLYYNRDEPFYNSVFSLLNEYHQANPRITVDSLDYLRDAAAAQRVKTQYKLTLPTATNLIIFECEGRPMVVDGNALTRYVLEPVTNEQEREFRRKPVEFRGEQMFTSALLAVSSPKPLHAYFLEGHGEHPIDSDDKDYGYLDFAAITRQNNIETRSLSLAGTNTVPVDCHLLVIAGAYREIPPPELQKIDEYLNQGGRLLLLFNFLSVNRETGLEKIVAKWGVSVGENIIKDPSTVSGSDVLVTSFSKHMLVNPLLGLSLELVEPRSVGKLATGSPTANAPQVEQLAFSSPKSFATNDQGHLQAFPLMVAVEKGALKGAIAERGATRMIVAGDSLFLANHLIGAAANRDFAGYALNWLLDRTQLLNGLGPRPIVEYRLLSTPNQLEKTRWILLAGMPGGTLLLGGLVWLRRRK